MDNSKDIIIDREKEQALIREYYDSPKAELVAIYGRRRVGLKPSNNYEITCHHSTRNVSSYS